MRHCRCVCNSKIPNSLKGLFIDGNSYKYTTRIHQTGMIIYQVSSDDGSTGFTCVKSRFLEHFDLIQEIREEKLNIILNITKSK